MLIYLKIKNFAIIDELEVDLQNGMTVVTGETGAGKSLIVDTLSLVLGDRADSSMIKNGAERCEITAIFALQHIKRAKQWLQDHELENANDINELIMQRTFSKDGRSRSSINGSITTLQAVKELGNFLVDIHSQHEHHSLLKNDVQRDLLDAYANNENLIAQIKQLYISWQKNHNELTLLQQHAQDRDAKIDLLNYQLQEFTSLFNNNLSLTPQNLEELKQEHSLLSNAEEIIKSCQNVVAIASENDNSNILTMLNTTQNILEKIKNKDPKINTICQLWENAKINFTEGLNELRHHLDHIELNQERLQILETHLQTIHNLARKHKVKSEELPNIQAVLTQQLQDLKTLDNKITRLNQQITAIENDYQKLATQITQTRSKAAEKLNSLITKKMQQLGMTDGKFVIKIMPNHEKQLTPYGNEQIEFQVTANLGHNYQSLAKVASGGELSRISLALQVVLAKTTTIPTLIFDEVDVGIGGKTAEIVGNLLRELGKHNQIICVTHLPQVASAGQHHIKIAKHSTNKTTITKLTNLNYQEKIQEIARMLGGINITPRTLAHAQEMLDKAAS
jgi:DNA repair protein RecN (Recombination protein N)